MKMTVRDAIKYISKADGMPFTMDLYNKITNFLGKLPRNPEDDKFGKITVRDYNEGWFAEIWYGKDEDGNMYVQVDGDNMDANPDRVKTNQEALQVIQEIKNIKFADDIDKYWNMTDDHKYWRRMNDFDDKAEYQRRQLLNKLR